MIRILAIVVVSFAAGVPAGYFLAISINANDKSDSIGRDFFKPATQADPKDAQEMKPRW